MNDPHLPTAGQEPAEGRADVPVEEATPAQGQRSGGPTPLAAPPTEESEYPSMSEPAPHTHGTAGRYTTRVEQSQAGDTPLPPSSGAQQGRENAPRQA